MIFPAELHPPREWHDFEDFWERFSPERGDPQATKHGRSGKAQNGVDIFGQRDADSHAVGCKHRTQFPESR